jgi:CHAT domain-containing protein/Tfp pilus assembly protein PilF
MRRRATDGSLSAITNFLQGSLRLIVPPAWAVLLLAISVRSSIAEEAKKGIVVEQTQNNFEAARAGIQKGDVILRWFRGDAGGDIASPIDLVVLEIEQEPRGPVTLTGLRGGENQSWNLGPNRWQLKTRPELPADLLATYLRGEDLAHAGKAPAAFGLWRELAEQVASREPAWLASWLMLHAAESLVATQQPKDSDEAYEQAVQFAARAGPVVRAQLFRAWASQCEQRGDLENAFRHFQQALENSQSFDSESLMVADNLNSLGRIAGRQGDSRRAEGWFLHALAIRNRLAPKSLPAAGTLSNLGLLARRRGVVAKAEDSFRRALAIQEELVPDSLDVALTINNLGLTAEDRGELEAARAHYSRTLEIRQKLNPGSLDVAGALNNLGMVGERLGDFENAWRNHMEALRIRERLAPDSAEVAESYNNLGILALDRGNLVAAEKYHSLALEIRTRKLSAASTDLAASFFNLGEVALLRRDLARAEDYHRRALAIKEKQSPGSVNLARSLARMALIAEERSDLVAAEKYLRQALQIDREKAPGSLAVAQNLNQLAFLAARQKRPLEAQEYLNEAVKIAQEIAPSGLNMAQSSYLSGELAQERRELAAAEAYYRQAVEIFTRLVPASAHHAEALAGLAKALWQEGRLDDAAQLFEQALNALESQAAILGGPEDVRFGFSATYSEYYSAYIDLLIAEKKPELAFAVFERSRAQSLRELLQAGSLDIHKDVEPKLLNRERELREELAASMTLRIRLLNGKHTEQQLAAIKQKIDQLLAGHREAESNIRASSPVFAALTQPQPLSTREVQQQLLDADTVLLEYAFGQPRSYLWVVTKDSFEYFELPARSQIEAAAKRFYKAVASPGSQPSDLGGLAAVNDAAISLSRILLSPAAGRIAGKRLVIIGDGALQYIPFSSLSSSVKRQRSDQEFVPLIVEHEIVELPSASVLALVRRARSGRRPAPKAVAVLADPVFDALDPRVTAAASGTTSIQPVALPLAEGHSTRSPGEVGWNHLTRLPFSQREATAILAVTPPGQGMGALGFEASRAKAISGDLAQYRVVHFATHGLFNSENPELSGLVLSVVDKQGRPQNGLLMLEDIYNLNLPAEMVVLSGCETARGKEIRGEGLIGLTRGFMYAGASRVLASLWSVDDVATASLMAELYKGMEQDSLTPAAALRRAQIKMWRQKRWRLPYYWAGFQLQGEWK